MFNIFLNLPWIGVGVGLFLQIHYLIRGKIPIIPHWVPFVGGIPVPFFPEPVTMSFGQWVVSLALVLGLLFGVPHFFFGEGKRPKSQIWDFCWVGVLAILLFYRPY